VNLVRDVLAASSYVGLAYFAIFGLVNTIFVFVAWRRLAAFRRARLYTALDETFASPFTPGVSVLVPAYNEEAGIVPSVRSLLDLRYPRHEVIVVNDGSTDGMLERLKAAFDLGPVRLAVRTQIATKHVRGTYVSRRYPNLCVLDKENGGKSDAINAGINAAAYPYVCVIDADAVLEDDALLRVVQPMIDNPETAMATGGIVRIANGCTIEAGRVTSYGVPRNRLAMMQVVEYFRAFLVGRLAWQELKCMIIISGAFGLFNRALVEELGGYLHGTVGEDIELVTRMHAFLRREGRPFDISFVPDPVCWTEAPEEIGALSRQRRRWQRGLAETTWRYRRQILNPRYGTLGLLALPYFVAFELLGAAFEAFGLLSVILAFALGAFSVTFFLSFLAVSILLSILISASSVVLEEYVIHRYERKEEIARMIGYSVAESFGYRQMNAFWRCQGLVDAARRKSGWGAQQRRGLERVEEVPLPPESRAA
jgi:cellulose synthase/poly-beta-1,6-N-acetylglucosamine synthase-like glycosyltransferase